MARTGDEELRDTRRRRRTCCQFVEAAYAVDAPAQAWTGGLLEAADQWMSTGLGGFACGFRGNADGTISIDSPSASVSNLTPEVANAIFDGLTRAPPGWLSSHEQPAQRFLLCHDQRGRSQLPPVVPDAPRAQRDPRRNQHRLHGSRPSRCPDLAGRRRRPEADRAAPARSRARGNSHTPRRCACADGCAAPMHRPANPCGRWAKPARSCHRTGTCYTPKGRREADERAPRSREGGLRHRKRAHLSTRQR